MSTRAYLPHSIAVATLAIQVIVTVQMFVVARAPGWHRARAFGWVALTAGLYSGMYAFGTFEIGTLAQQAINWRFSLVFGACHAAAWCRFAWAPDARSWGDVPPWLFRTVLGVVGAIIAIVMSGRAVDITNPVPVDIPSLGIRHEQPHTTALGGLVMIAAGALLAIALVGLVRRRREPGFSLVITGYCAFLAGVVLEALIAHFGWQIMFPAPIGFVAAIVPVTVLLQRQFSSDAERLAWLSSSLRGQLASRTEERDLAREALLRQEQVLSVGRLANGVGHQLSNPLQQVTLALHELEGLPTVPEYERLLGEVGAGVRRMEEVVRRLRDITDTDVRNDAVFPLARAVLTAESLIRPRHAQPVTLRTTVDDEHAEVLGDERALVRCFAALLLNAQEAVTRSGAQTPRVEVRVRRTSDATVVVDVRDSGPGFAADILAHVGEPFLPGGEKLGLGLHAVHRIVHAHGGTVTAGNLPSGGALVSVELPLASVRIATLPADTPVPNTLRVVSDRAPDLPLPGARATVLIVDDELLVRQAFARLLERQGYRVLTAEDGREAVGVLAHEHIDLVVTDLMMPEMSGVELAQHLSAHYPMLRERLLVVCGGAVTQDALTFVATPGLRVLEKPVAPTELLYAVSSALRMPARV